MSGEEKRGGIVGSQTLMRGLDVIEAVAEGLVTVPALAAHLGLTRPTAYRLAASLVERGYLASTSREGFRLGPKLLELGHTAREQADLIQVARPHLEALAEATEDTVHLGVLDDDEALYLDKVAGRRRVNISSRVGDRQPLTSTGLGKALMLDHPVEFWTVQLAAEQGDVGQGEVSVSDWVARMQGYVAAGRAFDLEENEDRIRCVAAPVRQPGGSIVAAISVSSAAQYMSDARMAELTETVLSAAAAISRDMGWNGGKHAA